MEAPAMTLQLEPPKAFRAVNALDPLRASIDLRAETFLRWAECETGLADWGNEGAFERFRASCEAVDANENLSTTGRLSLKIYLHFKFTNHLRIVEYAKRHPEVRDIPIEAPLVILGFYRTGTTLLHNLLGADPSHRVPRTWEVSYPVPITEDRERDRQLRRGLTAFILQSNRTLVPEQAAAHYVTVDGPEECFFMLENDGVSTTLVNTYQGYDLAERMLAWDHRPSYAFHKLQLQILSHRAPRKRWVLKCPYHLWHMDALLSVYPDARILHTHRDVAKSLPSNCSLSAMTTSKFARATDLRALGRFWSDFYRVGIDRALAVRETLPSSRILDVRLDDLARDPVTTVAGAYQHFGWSWDEHLASRYRLRVLDHPKDAHGAHVYSLEEFGLDPTALAARFADYHDRFDVLGRRIPPAGVQRRSPAAKQRKKKPASASVR